MPTAVARGRTAERLAACFLELSGFTVLDQNRRAADGEIDLIARDGSSLVFVEVRLRKAGAWVGAGRSIGRGKQGRLQRCARKLAQKPEFAFPGRRIRFDVVLLEHATGGLKLWHHRNVRLQGLPS